MKINIKDQPTKELEIDSTSVKDVLKELEINSLEVVVKKDDTIIHEDQLLTNQDEITVIKVVFGG
jgi:sulfur carrier protein